MSILIQILISILPQLLAWILKLIGGGGALTGTALTKVNHLLFFNLSWYHISISVIHS